MIKKVIILLSCILMNISVHSSEIKLQNKQKNNHHHREIAQALDNFHQAAANADTNTYFDLLTDDAVFLGTDATERWTKAEFKSFVVPYFSKGRGWLYQKTERNISDVVVGQIVLFDELLISESYGQCRGSGVLIKTEAGWKISQYNLSIPLPNELAKDITIQIKSAAKLKATIDLPTKSEN